MENKAVRKRSSAVRDQILEILGARKEALSPKDFQDILKGVCDRVTVYRALDRLHEEGRIHKITGVENAIQYALCRKCMDKHTHDHVHFNCIKCSKISCIENSEPTLHLPKEYQVQEIQCMVTGICPDCKS